MSSTRFRTVTAIVVGALLVTTLAASGAAFASGVSRSSSAAASSRKAAVLTLPQKHSAQRAAVWLASKVNAQGFISLSGHPDLSDTAQAVLALAAAGNEHKAALRALNYLKSHVNTYVTQGGTDGPGQLATLTLGAHALGVNPAKFGGTNLVTRLLATKRSSGSDVGLFGAQDPTYDGAYRQGIALAALAAAGVHSSGAVGPAITWLEHQQCSNGGWESYRSSTTTPCPPTDAATYSGPDTNSTALAIEGLQAQHAALHHYLAVFFRALQYADGGWGSYGGASDPDSTSLVVQALLSMHRTVSSSTFRRGTKDPVSAVLAFQLKSGAFYFPAQGSPKTANFLATEQAIPALMSKSLPF